MRGCVVALLALGLLGCPGKTPRGRPGKRTPKPPPPVTVPAEPYQTRSVYDEHLVFPSVAGPSAPNAETPTVYSWEGDLTGLSVDEEGARSVARHLAADPRWRLGVWDGVLVAFERRKEEDLWTVPRHGFHMLPERSWRGVVRFGDWTGSSEWASSSWVTRVGHLSTTLSATAFPWGGDSPLMATAISIDGPALALDLYEATPVRARAHTHTSLQELPFFLQTLEFEIRRIRRQGYVQSQMPSGQPAKGFPDLAVTTPAPGTLEVIGRVNPGGKGWTWIRILDTDLQPWETDAVAAATREVVGWSPNPKEQFYFQSQFPVPSGPRFSGTVELWFAEDPTGRPQRLGAFPADIPER